MSDEFALHLVRLATEAITADSEQEQQDVGTLIALDTDGLQVKELSLLVGGTLLLAARLVEALAGERGQTTTQILDDLEGHRPEDQ